MSKRTLLLLAPVLALVIAAPAHADGSGARAQRTALSRAAATASMAGPVLAPWPAEQTGEGAFRDALGYQTTGGAGGYAESMIGYAMLQQGIASGDRRLITSGLAALRWAAEHPSLQLQGTRSVFEDMAMAGAYTLARTHRTGDPEFEAVRPALEGALRSMTPIWITGRGFNNKYLVETVEVMELARSGLGGGVPGSWLSQLPRARALVRVLVGPRLARYAREYGTRVAGRRTAVLSDLPKNPLAYHALTFAFAARAVALLGSDATPQMRRTLAALGEGSRQLIAADGDVAYIGRSQSQAWALALTASGAEQTARLVPSAGSRMRGLAAIALARLDRLHISGAAMGLSLTPAMSEIPAGTISRAGLDPYAAQVSYSGLTAVALGWTTEQMTGGPEVAVPAAAGDSQAVLSGGPARFATVRHGGTWFAVKQSLSDFGEGDLRYDFGLIAAKRRLPGGSWRDIVAERPITRGPAQTAGPLLRLGAVSAFPYGESVSVSRGVVTITGGFRTADGRTVRSGVKFRFAAAGGDVAMRFTARAGTPSSCPRSCPPAPGRPVRRPARSATRPRRCERPG